VAHNSVREMKARRRKGSGKRERGKLKVGVDIPSPHELRAILHNAKVRWRPVLVTAAFTGLRASELRGLRWADVDFSAGEIHVRQRADRFNEIGKPKSHAGDRVVPFGKVVSNTLKEWRLACPKGELDLVFPTGTGKIECLTNIVRRGLVPAQIAAGVIVDGKAKYGGLHSLRHFYASWCINADGGLELPPKVAQERLGHSSITTTFDRYGHLFPRNDDTDLDAAELALMA
jgi:integrase